MSELGNKLLYALSIHNPTSSSTWRRYFDGLYSQYGIPDEPAMPLYTLRSRALRTLSHLSHIDFDRDKDRINVSPPRLARLPTRGAPCFVLTGCRTPKFVTTLERCMRRYRSQAQLNFWMGPSRHQFAPDTIYFKFDTLETASNYAELVGASVVSQPAAWSIITFAPSLREYMDTRVWKSEREPAWKKEYFDSDNMSFSAEVPQPIGTHFARYSDGTAYGYRYRLVNGSKHCECDLAWGRFAVIPNLASKLHHDSRASILRVPAGIPLPPLHSRALTLCSGIARSPSRSQSESSTSYAFSMVSSAMYEYLLKKLSANELGLGD